MKVQIWIAVLILIQASLGLTGCSDKTAYERPINEYPTNGGERPHEEPKVLGLPVKVEEIFAGMGLEKVTSVSVVNADGKVTILKTSRDTVVGSNVEFPIKTNKINYVTSISVIGFTGSNCQLQNTNGWLHWVCTEDDGFD